MEILKGKLQPPTQPTPKINYFQIAKTIAQQSWIKINRKLKNPEYQKTILLTAFLTFSIYICWRVEDKYDKLRKKATQTKTYKEVQIEKEN